MTITLEAKQGEATLYLVEVKQAGVFSIAGASHGGSEASDRQLLPERAVSLRARSHFGLDRQGRLSRIFYCRWSISTLCSRRRRNRRSPDRSIRPSRCRARDEPMAVIGAGSWGTALAIQVARAGHPDPTLGPGPRANRGDAALRGATCAICPRPSFPMRSSRRRGFGAGAATAHATRWSRCPRMHFVRR